MHLPNFMIFGTYKLHKATNHLYWIVVCYLYGTSGTRTWYYWV